MAVLIKDDETDRLIRQLAARRGQSITQAVKAAVREQLDRTPPTEAEIAERLKGVKEILARADALPNLDDRSPEEIIGYNERGHFD